MSANAARRDGIADRTCPDCKGEGERQVYVHGLENGRGFCRWQAMICFTCGGIGFVTDSHAERLERGRRLREDRVGRGVTLREEAVRLGIPMRELSDKEWGRK